MTCPKCGNPEPLVEDQPNGDQKVSCPKCGLREVYDREGRKLLLDAGGRGNVLLS